MKIKIIIPYFGKLPNYFEFFLKSCKANKELEFLIFTDQISFPEYPENVSIYTLSFDELKALAKEKLSLDLCSLKNMSPYKLCDYRPSYGVLFEDYLHDADFWGFCDIDLIFGRIFDILSLKEVSSSERILTQGHLTFYKNIERINHLFEQPIEGGISFREATRIKEPCFFDEIFMPAICKKQKVVQYGKNVFADILPQYSNFTMAPLCEFQNEEGQTFCWECGKLYRIYDHGKDELMYIHLQKRPLPYRGIPVDYAGKVYITPQGFFTEETYTIDCEKPSENQVQNYQKKRWTSLTLRKIWIKIKVNKFKE